MSNPVIYGEGNVTTRREILTKNIRSQGFQDIRGVILRNMILQRLGSI